MSNPFERFDIDPMLGPAAITERMRELVEEADDAEREELRAVWEDLTMHPRRRFEVALDAFPETRAPLPGHVARRPLPVLDGDAPLTLRELAVVPRIAGALGDAPELTHADLLPPLESDPFIEPRESTK